MILNLIFSSSSVKGCHAKESKQKFIKCNIEILDDEMKLSNSCALNQFIRLAGDIKVCYQHVILMELNLQSIKLIISNDGKKCILQKLEARCKYPEM